MSLVAGAHLFAREMVPVDLRDYQEEAIQSCRTRIRHRPTGEKKVILCGGTGSGKTEMAIAMIQSALKRGKRIAFLVERNTLLTQTAKRFAAYGLTFGMLGGGIKRGLDLPLLLISQQTLERRDLPEDFDLIFVDETHIQRKIITKWLRETSAVVIGLTATPFTKGLAETYPAGVVNARTTSSLISDNWLIRPRIFCGPEADMSGAKIVAGEYRKEDIAERGSYILADIVGHWEKRTREVFGGPVKTIAFSATIQHGERMVREFEKRGYPAIQVASGMSPETIKAHLKAFARNEYLVLVSVDMLGRGYDQPDILCGITARHYVKSLAGVIQQIGRVMRASPETGKRICLWLDCCGNMARLGEEVEKFWSEGCRSLKVITGTGRESRERQCAACGYLSEPGAQKCENCDAAVKCGNCGSFNETRGVPCGLCGEELKERRLGGGGDRDPVIREGALHEWKPGMSAPVELWPEICHYARSRYPDDRERALRFARAQHMSITGAWPRWGVPFTPGDYCSKKVERAIRKSLRNFVKQKREEERASEEAKSDPDRAAFAAVS